MLTKVTATSKWDGLDKSCRRADAWVITDGKGKEVPYSVLVDMPDAVPGFDASRMEKRTVANLENVMGAFMDRYHGPAEN